MPELPEVETARRSAHRRLIGRRIVRVEAMDGKMLEGSTPEEFASFLEGRRITGTDRHGKHLFLLLNEGALRIHLGMSGSLNFFSGRESTLHQRLVFEMDRGRFVLDDPRRFGRFQLVPDVPTFVAERGLGPDALSIGRDDFRTRVGRGGRAIKSVLLDQTVVAGIGNLYADEVLFQERLSPLVPAKMIPANRLEMMRDRVVQVLQESIRLETDFELMPAGYLLRRREVGCACPRGDGVLESSLVGGRTSIYCPVCQMDASKLR